MPDSFDLTDFLQPGVLIMVFGAMAIFATGAVVDVILLVRLMRRPPGWFPRFAAVRSRPWTWVEALSILVVLFVFRLAMALCSDPPPDLECVSTAEILWPLFLSTLGFHGVGFLLVILCMRLCGAGWRSAFGSSIEGLPRSALRGIVGYFAVMPVVMTGMVITAVICTLIGYRPEPQIVVQILQRTDSAFLMLYLGTIAVTAAPLVEELLFRGVGLSFLGKHMHPVAAILCVSAFFAAVHMHIPSMLPIFLLAVGLSAAYVYTGDILVPVVMHAMFNAVSLIAALVVKDAMPFG